MSKWWDQGVRFQCQGSGKCCLSRGAVGFVYLTLNDRKRFARGFGITTEVFTRKFCEKTNGFFHLKEEPDRPECMFLKDKRCSVYESRPTQCRTWPFWPEVMGPKRWKQEVASFCPGVGKGPLRAKSEIDESLKAQAGSDSTLAQEALR